MIIATRVDEILDLVKKHILENNIDEDFYQHIVITGGGSRLNGLSEYIRAKNFLIGSEVTIGQPVGIVSDDSYATSASFFTRTTARIKFLSDSSKISVMQDKSYFLLSLTSKILCKSFALFT